MTPPRHNAGAGPAWGAYRPEIDGLRALAVVPVILFHAGVRGFSGGFVGVDVFFVISGYLITGILARDIVGARYSIAEFYRRRILRILPALAAMLLATTIAVPVFLLPPDLPGYARALAATALFASNVEFYLHTDYFNLGTMVQPLLHTWSLAVEEQWYIVWPLVLALAGRRGVAAMAGLALVVTAASFAFALWLLPRDSAAAFYLLPSRAWELGLGAVIALLPHHRARPATSGILTALGVAAVLACVKIYTKDTPFPGLAALPVCAGAALVLRYGSASCLAGRVLSSPPLRFLGLISYSLYLWHWPVLQVVETGLLWPMGWKTTPLVLAVIFALATASWWFVERPFRDRGHRWSAPKVIGGGVAVLGAFAAMALIVPSLDARASGYDARDLAMASNLAFDGDGAYRRGRCFRVGDRSAYDAADCLAWDGRKPALLVVGDSHAAQLWPGLSRHQDRYAVLQATATGCVAKLYPRDTGDGCQKVINLALRGWIARHRPAALIIASRWQWRSLDGVEQTLRDPVVHGANPVLIGPIPQYPAALPRILVAAARRNDPMLPWRVQDSDVFAIDATMRAIAARTGTRYISLVDLLCDARRFCRTEVAPGSPLQFDTSHLTERGSRLVVDAILPQVVAPRAD